MTENNEPKSWEEAAEREFAALEEEKTDRENGEENRENADQKDKRDEKTFRWYFSVIGEVLLIVPILLVLYFLGKAFGAL